MSPNTILGLQSALIVLQMINAGLVTTTHNLTVTLVVGAIVGGFQYFVQHIGNQTVPPPKVPATDTTPAGGSKQQN